MNLNFCHCGKEREMKKLVSVCVFLLALVTGVFAMAREPVYGVLFIPKKEYTLEKGKFRATVPQVQAVSFIDGRTPVNECGGAAKAVNKQLRAYVDKAYQDYQKEGEPGTWVYPMITKNGDNIYSLVMVKQILHGQLDVYMDDAFTFLQNTGKRVSWKDIVRKEDERFMTVESLEKNIREGMFFYKDGVWSSERPAGCIPDGYRPAEMPGPYRFYVDDSNLIIFMLPCGENGTLQKRCFELNSGAATKYSRAVG